MRSLIFWLIGMVLPRAKPYMAADPIAAPPCWMQCQLCLTVSRAREPHQRRIEGREKARAVGGRERLRPTRDGAGAAKVAHQVAGRERHADGILGKRLAVGRDGLGAGLHGARRKWHIGRD